VIDTPLPSTALPALVSGRLLMPQTYRRIHDWNFAMQAMDQLINSAAKTRYMSAGK